MTGNANPPTQPPRKIQALTVSVNYADFLECIAPNVRHFDRWLVVTHESDTRTREVCRRWGMEVLLSQRLYENGAAFHKAAALNEGMEALDQDGWVAVMDSDILLPHDFRERLDAQELVPECLYGLGGRRICSTLHEFTSLAATEPWADNLIYTTFVIGYFNLFHLSGQKNRYPEDASDDASAYDVAFSDSFPAANRRYLPFVCLHAGDASRNWRGRVTDPFFEEGTLAVSTPAGDSTLEVAAALGGPDKTAAQIGCYRGALTRTLAKHFRQVMVFDHWGLLTSSPSPAMAVDAQFLASRYARETQGIANCTAPLEHSEESVLSIAEGSLDVIWLTAEPEYDFLLNCLPLWLTRLKPGGFLAGGFYESRLLPGPSRVVDLLLGPPERQFPDFHWFRRIADPAGLAAKLSPPAVQADSRQGVVYVCMDEDDVEALLVSCSSLRRHWQGPVCLLSAGEENPSLRLAATRLGLDFRNIPCVSDKYPEDLNLLHALEWSPFEESLFIAAPTLVRQSPQPFFDALAKRDAAFCQSQGRRSLPVEWGAFAWRRGSEVLDTLRGLAASLLIFNGKLCVRRALYGLLSENALPVLPPGPVWSGPAKRAPGETIILEMPRLARAGALHLLPEWEAEEQTLIAIMQQEL